MDTREPPPIIERYRAVLALLARDGTIDAELALSYVLWPGEGDSWQVPADAAERLAA